MIERSKSGSFEILVKITDMALQKIAREVNYTKKNMVTAKEKVQILTNFKQDYLERNKDKERNGQMNEQYLNYHNFMTGLEHSIEKQTIYVQQCMSEYQQLETQVNLLRQKKLLYEKLIEKEYARQLYILEKNEQKRNDSFVQLKPFADEEVQGYSADKTIYTI